MRLEKRRDIRFHHKNTVELATATGSIKGLAVNISRRGIQVVVRMPESYDSISSITFTIPSGERVQLPCRLVRSSIWNSSRDRILGIEFLAGAENQLTLIEKHIEELQRKRKDTRELPRTTCHIDDVSTDRPDVQILSIDNLSTEGLLVSYVGGLQAGDSLHLNVAIPGDSRPLRLQGKVVYVIQNAFRETLTAGLRLLPLKDLEERRLQNLILAYSSGGILRNVHQHLQSLPLAQEYRIGDSQQITRTFLSLMAHSVPLSLLIEGSFTVREHTIIEVNKDQLEFSIRLNPEDAAQVGNAGRAAYFAFSWKGNSYYYKTAVSACSSDRLSFQLPIVLFRSDNRSYQRKLLQQNSELRLSIAADGEESRSFDGTLINISRRGFLCEIFIPVDCVTLFQRGKSVHYSADERLGLDRYGQIRHVRSYPSAEGVLLRLGIEAGIERHDLPIRRLSAEEWQRGMPYQGGTAGPMRRIGSRFVRIKNQEGKEICAFINATALPVQAPVVIIPPAYGKKKEAYAPLVATLLANFWAQNKDLVLIRYDGINRPGESHQGKPKPKRGYEMLAYRWGQGFSDLQTILGFVRNNPHFTARQVVLLTFSMSAIEARRLLALQEGCGIDLWISCMGATCAQSTLRNALGGIDVIGNHRTGIPNGIMGLLGHLIDMDLAARDLVEKKYAYLTDARLDMSRIGIPVFWICGRFDKWIEMAEVADLMSVSAGAPREMLEIPMGHNLRTSDDAIQTFKLMAGYIYEKLHGERLIPRNPSKEEMVRLLISERERLPDRSVPLLSEYWRAYLIGSDQGSAGYDYYRNIEEIMAFLKAEVQSLSIEDGEVIADLGCGTGLFLEVLLDSLAQRRQLLSGCEITAVDLVQEALDKAREKSDRLLEANPSLRVLRFNFIQANLEPNRLIPVAEFMRSKTLTFDFLRGKIEGLSNATLDFLKSCESPELQAFMRGELFPAELPAYLQGMLGNGQLPAVLEFNRAARFLAQRIEDADLRPLARSRKHQGDALKTTDLIFDTLNFGEYGRKLALDFPDSHYTKIVASLFISYLFNPRAAVAEFYRMLKPGGTLLVSSMKPDSDISLIFTNFVAKLQQQERTGIASRNEKAGLSGALAMLNEAASLFELEEDGIFTFFTAEELRELLRGAGFSKITVQPGMGNPPQAYMAIAQKET
jgi:ubiquinone/menaquinone biosynthesis C-methylase UbiE/pimeloyl-ACP methyl ester carboxylesterase